MLAGSAVLGFFAYGISLMLFVVALRHLGTARTGVVVLFVQIGALWLEAQYPCGFTAVATPGR